MDFCDSPFYSPVRRFTLCGPIDPKRCMEIINAYVLAFFQANLNVAHQPLLDRQPSPFPEVVLDRFPGQDHAPNRQFDRATNRGESAGLCGAGGQAACKPALALRRCDTETEVGHGEDLDAMRGARFAQ